MNNFKQIAKQVLIDINSRDSKPEMPTGLTELDDLLWGMKRGKTVVIAGRTSMGKSAVQLFVAKNIADMGKKVVIISLEMTKEENVERILCDMTGINNEILMKGQATTEHRAKLQSAIDHLPDNLNFQVFDDKGYTWKEAEEIIKREKPDIAMIDYIQMCSSKDSDDDKVVLGEYTRQSKRMAKEYKLCVVLGSQINRKGEQDSYGQIPRLSTMKGSGVLEENADAVLIVHWWWKYHSKKEDGTEYSPNDYAIYVAKNRGGRTGVVNVLFYPETYTYKDIKRESKQEDWYNK